MAPGLGDPHTATRPATATRESTPERRCRNHPGPLPVVAHYGLIDRSGAARLKPRQELLPVTLASYPRIRPRLQGPAI